jgi:predicted ArsR family transcriptional regulator
VAAAHDVGRRHGATLAASTGDAADPLAAGTDATTDPLAPLVALGGDYAVDADRVLARNCIFAEACRCAPEVVCGLHAGLIEGALSAGGVRRRVTPCDGAASDDAACAYRLDPLPA